MLIDAVADNLGVAPSDVPRVIDGRGHPRAVISQEQLLHLHLLNFLAQIAKLMVVSRIQEAKGIGYS